MRSAGSYLGTTSQESHPCWASLFLIPGCNTGGLNPENSEMSPTPSLMDSKVFAIFWKNSLKEHKQGCYLNISISNRGQLWESGAQMIRKSVVWSPAHEGSFIFFHVCSSWWEDFTFDVYKLKYWRSVTASGGPSNIKPGSHVKLELPLEAVVGTSQSERDDQSWCKMRSCHFFFFFFRNLHFNI